MKRILVTGGAGFVGSHLCERLVADGNHVLCFDNFFTGSSANVAWLLADEARGLVQREGQRFELIRGDVCDPMHFEVDEIYHLACPASPVHYQRNPVRTIRTGVQGTLNALELARNVGARILIASTSEIYGDPEVHPQVESYHGNVNPIGPRACYDEAKRCGEALAASYASQYGVEVRIARIFNTYGPRMSVDDGRVVSNFIVQALRGEPLTVYGDGSQTRSFMFVSDLVEGLTRLMANGDRLPVNLGNPGEFTMLELANKVSSLVGRESNIVNKPLPKDDPVRRKPDITRAKTLLSWEPKVSLDEGLSETVNYFRGIIPRIKKTT